MHARYPREQTTSWTPSARSSMISYRLPRPRPAGSMHHHGVATTSDLRHIGLGRRATERLVELGVLRRVDVASTRSTTDTTKARSPLSHAVLLTPGRLVTGPLPPCWPDSATASHRRTSLLAPPWAHPDPMPGVRSGSRRRSHRTTEWLDADGIVATAGAVWARSRRRPVRTRPPVGDPPVARQAARTSERARGSGPSAVPSGAARQHDLPASLLEIGAGVHDSHREVQLGDALLRRGVQIEAQVEVDLGDRPRAIWTSPSSAVRWGVELDIHPEHRSVDGDHGDARRVRSLHVRGWQVELVPSSTWTQLLKSSGRRTLWSSSYRERLDSMCIRVSTGARRALRLG